MTTKTKLTEIRETYTVKHPVKNSTGERTYEEKNFVRYKEVAYVTGWSRFGHYILDGIFYYIFAFILAIPLVLILISMGVNVGDDNPVFGIFDRLISWLILYPGYYILFESSMQSTPGKLIMGRIVVNEYGEKPTFKDILIRSYSRAVPFEALSCFSDLGWHDKWSNTFVIRKKDLYELELALKAQEFGKDIDIEPQQAESTVS